MPLKHLPQMLFIVALLLPLSLRSETLTIGLREQAIEPEVEMAIDLVQDAAQSIDLHFQFERLPSKRSLHLAAEGVLDGEFYRHSVIEPLYPSLVRVNVPIGGYQYYVWVYREVPCMNSQAELAQLKPVGHRGAKFYEMQVYPLSKVGYEEVLNISMSLEMLQRGRADYTVHEPNIMQHFAKLEDIQIKRCFNKPLFSMPFYLYLHESNQALIPQLEKAIRESPLNTGGY